MKHVITEGRGSKDFLAGSLLETDKEAYEDNSWQAVEVCQMVQRAQTKTIRVEGQASSSVWGQMLTFGGGGI